MRDKLTVARRRGIQHAEKQSLELEKKQKGLDNGC